MPTYLDFFALRTGPDGLINRFTVATDRAAAAILIENAATPNHAARQAWAFKALLDPSKSQSYASLIMRYAVAADAATQANTSVPITDDQIQTLVNSAVAYLVAAGV